MGLCTEDSLTRWKVWAVPPGTTSDSSGRIAPQEGKTGTSGIKPDVTDRGTMTLKLSVLANV